MKTICGVTMRGSAYFGASVHICIGMIFFVFFLDQLVHSWYDKNFNMDGFDRGIVIYFALFLPIGILIFKAIDKENKTLLKWASAIFLTLQLFGMIIKVKFGHLYATNLTLPPVGHHSNGPSPTTVIDNFKILLLEIVSTVAYLVTLYLYGRQLECFPGSIYSQGGIPLYSTNSTFFTDNRTSHRHGRGRSTMSTTPFTYNFEPPPPYSSVNNLSNMTTVEGSAQSPFGNQQQPTPCSSRTVFQHIGRIGNISFKKSAPSRSHHNITHHQNPSSPNNAVIPHSPVMVVVNATNDLNRSSSRCIVIPSESNSSSAPLLHMDTARQNDLSVTSGRRSRHDDSLLNLKEVD